MRKSIFIGALPLILILTGTLFLTSAAHAATYNQNKIMDDVIFDDTSTMNVSQINTFLNGFSASCISQNNGFSAPDPTGYSPSAGFSYGGNVSAGQVIYDAAQAYGINPQVLLATLQKEQSLVTGSSGCSTLQYAAAVGYGCPDGGTTYSYTNLNLYTINGSTVTSVSGTCVNSSLKAGFSQQIIRAAWLLRFGEQRSEGNINWAVIKGNWDNSDDPQTCYSGPMTQGTWQVCPSGASVYYDGYTTIDSTSVHIDNGATAALYWYTPHFSGNQNLVNIFTNWFGSTYTNNYALSYYAMSGYPTVKAGQSVSVWIEYQNTGQGTFFDDSTAGIVGEPALHLADSSPINRVSPFYDSSTWINNNRPSTQFAAVYESDGTTLAANQHQVANGQIVKFTYSYTVPLTTQSGTYTEPIQPVREGSASWGVGGWGYFQVIVTDPDYRAASHALQSYPAGYPGDVMSDWIEYQNTGTQPWYDNVSVPSGGYPLHLADSSPINRVSPFYDSSTWINNNRPSTQFAAVYESDGTTLAANQHVAQPGQIVKFAYSYRMPFGASFQTYAEYIQPVLEGASNWNIGGYGFVNVTLLRPPAYKTNFYAMSGYPTVKAGQSVSVWIEYQNTGTQAWYDDTSRPSGGYAIHYADTSPINRVSPFYDSSTWINNNRPSTQFAAVYESDGTTLAANQHVAQPGQIVKFAYSYNVPGATASGTYTEQVQPVVEGYSNWSIPGGWGYFLVTVTQ